MSDVSVRCAPFEANLSALSDSQLDADRASEVRAHVASCADCARRLAALGAVDAALRQIASAPIPAARHARMRAAIAQAKPVHRAPPRRRRWLAPAAMVAAAAAAAALVLVLRPPAPVAPTPAEVVVAESAAPRSRADAEQAARTMAAKIDTPIGASAPPPSPSVKAEDPAALAPTDLLAAASDDDLALAEALREFPALDSPRDLALVQQLDLLETLSALDDAKQERD